MSSLQDLLRAAGADGGLLPLLLALAILIAAAKLSGELAARIGQPTVLGELAAGLILGPTFLNVLAMPLLSSSGLEQIVQELGELGVIMLMFLAGLEVELSELRRSGRPALLAGGLGVVVPMALGMGTGLLFDFPLLDAIFLGITASATSVSISAQTLLELGRLRSREGFALLGAAVVDDLLVILFLSVFLTLERGEGGVGTLVLQLLRMLLTLGIVAALSIFVLPRLAAWATRLRVSEGLLAIALAAVFLLSWAMEYFGDVAAITGAFLAGVGLGRSHLRQELEAGLHRLAYAFFVPLFLVSIGLQANLRTIQGQLVMFAVIFILMAMLSKLLGSGLGARLGGFNIRQSFRVGLGMISRGEVGLIVAGVGVVEGVLPQNQFSVVVLMILITTLVTPPLLRWSFQAEPQEGSNATTR